MNNKQEALAAEIRAEMAAQRIKATDMQARTGIKHASWRNWFVTAARPVPYPELEKVCAVLGVPLSELLRRAESRTIQQGAGPRVDVDKILSESPELAAVREEGRRVTARRTTASD